MSGTSANARRAVPQGRVEARRPQARVPDEEVQAAAGEELGRQQAGHGGQRPPGQLVDLGQPVQRGDSGDRITRPRHQLEASPRDDRERPFRP